MISEIQEFLNKMNSTNSSNDKVELITHATKNVRKVLYYTYNNFLQYNITPKVLNKRQDLSSDNTKYESMFELLESLNQRLITGHAAIKEVNGFISCNPGYKDLLYLMLERNLKIRASVSLINRALPGLIPTFNVALANKYDEKTKKKIHFDKDTWFVSRKLDGVRCLIIVDDKGNVSSFSRAGKKFKTLSLIEQEIKELGVKNIVYDGEMCIVDKDGNEDFQSIMKEIGRKDHTIQNGLFQIFDFIPYRMFSKGYGESGTFSQRIFALQNLLLGKDLKSIDFLEQLPVSSFDELEKLTLAATQKSWEGLMIRKNVTYQGKRSNDILKIKTFHDAEYEVINTFFGPLRYIKEGAEVEEEMLSGVAIEHKGNIVRVGSGFTIDQRKHLYNNPKDILGKTITVQYFEESQNQLGEYSLRFPVIKVIHGEKREF